MLESILPPAEQGINLSSILICTLSSLIFGLAIAFVYMYRHIYNKNFVVTLALLPTMVQAVIFLVSGNLGTGVAVMGAFSLVRFRSAPGNAKDIASIFFAMAVGLATGMGYIAYAAIFTVIISLMMLLYARVRLGESATMARRLKIIIPEDLDYASLFDDVFYVYTQKAILERVRTTNLGSLYELQYSIVLSDSSQEKKMLDTIRQRNGNLSVICSRAATSGKEDL